jgi:hypothetical protein
VRELEFTDKLDPSFKADLIEPEDPKTVQYRIEMALPKDARLINDTPDPYRPIALHDRVEPAFKKSRIDKPRSSFD